jgi:hypothetical protein
MLTLDQFKHLPNIEKGTIIFNDAEFIAERREGVLTILLYQLYSFYVEVYYQQDLNEIQRLRTFSNTELLEPYLDQLNIQF